jgi:hypothetical protein
MTRESSSESLLNEMLTAVLDQFSMLGCICYWAGAFAFLLLFIFTWDDDGAKRRYRYLLFNCLLIFCG